MDFRFQAVTPGAYAFVGEKGGRTHANEDLNANIGLVFSGDTVYVDRMLGVIPVSHTGSWLASFAALEALQSARIVPGHGDVCELPRAQAQTRDYLQALRTHMKQAVENGTEIGAAIKAFDAKPWLGLLNAAELHPGNASRTYLELERE